MKNILQRTCISCNEKKEKEKLIRIVKNKNGEITIDVNGKMQGRGAYICKDMNCLKIAIKKKKIEKSFSCKVDENIYENLINVINDNK